MAFTKASASILALRLAGKLSLGMAQRIGRILGTLGGWLPTQAKKVTTANINLCFPEMPEEERKRLIRSSLRHTGQTFMEIPLMWEWPVEKCLGLIREVEGLDLVDNALAEGKGVVLLAPHLGNWELAGLFFSSRYKMAALYSPPHIHEFEDYMVSVRGRLGSELVRGDRRGLARLASILREGGVAGILPDQSPSRSKSNVFAPFFNNDVRTMTLANKLIQKTHSIALVTYAERLDNSRGFRIIVTQADPEMASPDSVTAATALNRSIEKVVKMAPTQYQWEYKRFRHLKDLPNPYS